MVKSSDRRSAGRWALGATLAAALGLSAPFASVANAAEHVVRMYTDGGAGRFVFEPAFLQVEVGDSVRFVTTAMMYDSKSIAGMTPPGATSWWSEPGSEMVVAFDLPGVYGYKCSGYYENGMVGLILVGDEATNLAEAAAVRHPAMAADAFRVLFRQAECALDAC